MEETKKILYRLHKNGSITDEELDILLQAVNKNDGMFPPGVTTPYPNEWPWPCPCRPITITYKNPLDGLFGPIQ